MKHGLHEVATYQELGPFGEILIDPRCHAGRTRLAHLREDKRYARARLERASLCMITDGLTRFVASRTSYAIQASAVHQTAFAVAAVSISDVPWNNTA